MSPMLLSDDARTVRYGRTRYIEGLIVGFFSGGSIVILVTLLWNWKWLA